MMRLMLRLLACLSIAASIVSCASHPATAAELAAAQASAADGNRLAYLDENNPWYPHLNFPKLVTPQWVGEEGVECVVVLAIDDMREPAKYEAYLRPILNRLKQIDGRAPVSIMTCSVKPDDPQLAAWLGEGLSFEVHTVDHPCPLLQGGDFARAKSTYDRCVDLLNEIPGNKPVAFRMPCCDSLNTVSPRFYSEIFNSTTAKGNFLALDSSVFNLCTANDLEIPRELRFDPDGREKFRKYVPKNLPRDGKLFNTFVNYIEDYPYPYVINRFCWEFPCVVPSDWSAQHLQKPFNPDTVRDLKAALDITVLKQGVFNLVFHPHGWIKAEQVVEIIDHAVSKHGRKVKFLTFREALERLNRNVLGGHGLRTERGQAALSKWEFAAAARRNSRTPPLESVRAGLPQGLSTTTADGRDAGLRFVDINEDGYDDIVFSNAERFGVYLFENAEKGWSRVVLEGTRSEPNQASGRRKPAGGAAGQPEATAPDGPLKKGTVPPGDADMSRESRSSERDSPLFQQPANPPLRSAIFDLPPIVRADGTDNGFFVHSRQLFWQNEDTAKLLDLVDRRSFDEILAQADLPPAPRSPEAALKSLHVLPG